MSDTPQRRFRELLERPGLVPSLGAHDVFSAMIIEQSGFELVFLGGFGASASLLGLPDLGYISAEQMADCVRRTAARVSIPIIADGDTGHGDLHNVRRTVELFEAAGAAGIIIEDQVAPKRCGHFDAKQVIAADEMVLKIRAAADARRDPDFAIFARTDAIQMNGLDDAIDRANRCHAAGADVAFIEAPQSIEDLEAIPSRVDCPLFVNMLAGGVTPILTNGELEKLGYKISVCPVETLMVCASALRDLCAAVLRDGRADEHVAGAASFAEIKQLLGVEEHLASRDRLFDAVDDAPASGHN